MTAIKRLTEEEKCLIAILKDRSGIAFSEFFFQDSTSQDKCFRLFPYQWKWFNCDDEFQISACARAVGKTVSIVARAIAFLFANAGHSILITAPRQVHLNPITKEIEKKLLETRLFKEILQSRGATSNGIRKGSAFEVDTVLDSHIITRLPNLDGTGVKGQHTLDTIVDEAQDAPEPMWSELTPTRNSWLPNSHIMLFGVTAGLGGTFDDIADGKRKYTVHRKMRMERPDWSDDERDRMIQEYKSPTSIKYSRNIYGYSMGDSSDNFVVARLMAATRINETDFATKYNEKIYQQIEIISDQLRVGKKKASDCIILPGAHLDREYSSYWGGLDVGLTRDPSELTVFGMTKEDKFRLLTRIHMEEIPLMEQSQVVQWVMKFYGKRFKAIGVDKGGIGVGLFEDLSASAIGKNRTFGYYFSEKLTAGFEDRERKYKEKESELELKLSMKEYGLKVLQDLVNHQRIELPYDTELLSSLLGSSDDHILDSCRLFGAVFDQQRIEAIKEAKKPRRSMPIFG